MSKNGRYPKADEPGSPNTSSVPSPNHSSKDNPEPHRDVRVYDGDGKQSDKLHIPPSKK